MINDPFNPAVKLGTEGSEVSLMGTACVLVFVFAQHNTCGTHTHTVRQNSHAHKIKRKKEREREQACTEALWRDAFAPLSL